LIHEVLPRIEAYHETLNRRPLTEMTAEHLRYLKLQETLDESEADRAAAQFTLNTTPLPAE
jgi:hypothetical protein